MRRKAFLLAMGLAVGMSTLASAGCSDKADDAGARGADAGQDTNLPLGQIDRLGRPEAPRSHDESPAFARDAFAGDASDAARTVSEEGVDDHLKFFDTLGPTVPATKWSESGNAAPSVARRNLEVLMVDPNKPFPADEKAFLTIEDTLLNGARALNGVAYASCGGRVPNENVVDKILSYLVLRRFEGICTGVRAASKPAGRAFPYLAPPN